MRIALAYKKIPYQLMPVASIREETDPIILEEFKKATSLMYVPLLSVGGTPIGQSVAIIDLLDQLYPDPPLFPSSPIKRAQVGINIIVK